MNGPSGPREDAQPRAGESTPLLATTRPSFPRPVFFIIGSEFCERFSFYGMKAILPIYLTRWLACSEHAATTVIHSFNFAAYGFTFLGGLLSDSGFGRYRTILLLSLVYSLGSATMALAALDRHPAGTALGLALVALGTGGIKPCVSSFGGDQFAASQAALLAFYFSSFYFAINAGSVLSMVVTPILRSDVHCLGQESCYPLAFGVPALLMLVATLVFLAGSRHYRHAAVRENAVAKTLGICWLAGKRRLWQRVPAEHWLDLAAPEHSEEEVGDVRVLSSILAVFLPVCLFWALYDQQGSRWTYQAVLMDGRVGLARHTWTVKPEQMGIANAVLILALIPVFERGVYPVLRTLGFRCRALSKMAVGMGLAVLSFLAAAALQFLMMRRGTFAASADDPDRLVCVGGCVHVLWQLPQYVLLTGGEIMLSITGLEFAYAQAPVSMRSVCQAAWLLTVAGGNLAVIFLNVLNPVGWLGPEGRKTHAMTLNLVLWAAVGTLGLGLFVWLARGYEDNGLASAASGIEQE